MNENTRVNDIDMNKEKLEKFKLIDFVKEYLLKIMNSQNFNNIIKKQKHPKVYNNLTYKNLF